MEKLNIKWFDLVKWSTQFLLSSLLLILAYNFFMRGGDRGMILRQLLPPCILAISLGVILGDLSLLGKKFIIIVSAVPIVIVLSFVGLMLGLFFAELVYKFHLPISNVKDVIGIVFFFGATTAPPIIIYNYLTKSTRKCSDEVKEEESKKQEFEGEG